MNLTEVLVMYTIAGFVLFILYGLYKILLKIIKYPSDFFYKFDEDDWLIFRIIQIVIFMIVLLFIIGVL